MKHRCDGCGKDRSDVRSVGRDYNGDPDAPDMCFICRKEGERGNVWNDKIQGYVHHTLTDDDLTLVEEDTEKETCSHENTYVSDRNTVVCCQCAEELGR